MQRQAHLCASLSKPFPSARLRRSGDTDNGIGYRVEYWGGFGLDFGCARNQSKAPPGAGVCFSSLGHIARRDAVLFNIRVQISAMIFHAPAKFLEGRPHPTVPAIAPVLIGAQ